MQIILKKTHHGEQGSGVMQQVRVFNLLFNFKLNIMAVFKMSFIHKLTKSMANNTYYHSRGQNILKTKIDSNSSNTLPQQKQRAKMGVLFALCKVFNSAIKIGFRYFYSVECFCKSKQGYCDAG